MIIVEVQIKHDILLTALSGVPEATLRWEQTDLTAADRVKMLAWLEGTEADVDTFEEHLSSDPSVSEYSRLTSAGERHLYQFYFTESARERSIYRGLVETGSVVKRATATADGWEFDIAFPSQSALDEFQSLCEGTGPDYRVRRVFTENATLLNEPVEELTDKQRELLRMATERGYFAVPREANLGDLADALDISHQAASERLRRAQAIVNRRIFDLHEDGEAGADRTLSAHD